MWLTSPSQAVRVSSHSDCAVTFGCYAVGRCADGRQVAPFRARNLSLAEFGLSGKQMLLTNDSTFHPVGNFEMLHMSSHDVHGGVQ